MCVLVICIYFLVLGDTGKQHIRAQPNSAQVLLKHSQRNLCCHCIKHTSRGHRLQNHRVIFNRLPQRYSVTQHTNGLYIIQLKSQHIIRGPNGWKEDLEIIGDIIGEQKNVVLM